MRVFNSLYFILCFITVLIAVSHTLQAQHISGQVTDKNNAPLAFANVYVHGTSIGTTTNEDGKYFLNLQKGNYTIVCEYLGYKTKQKTVSISAGENVELNFTLQPSAVNLQGVEVSSDKENPAYRIIRNARNNRKKNLNTNLPQKCSLYMKGNIGLYDTPERFMGMEIPDTNDIQDSIGSNVIYLSETVSTLYRTENGIKEVIHSNRVSGSSAFSFNRGKIVEYSIYEKNITSPFGKLINPIGPSAFQYYDYKLLSKNYTKSDVINKILVISKNSEEPTVEGTIYISEDGWKVDGFTFYSEGKRVQKEAVDTFKLSQKYISVEEGEVLFKNSIEMQLKVFGFEVNGFFNTVYTDYEFGQNAEIEMDPRLSVEFEDSSTMKSIEYWEKIRPIPLSEKEKKDYQVKDSIASIHRSDEYKDSVDQLRNQYEMNDFLFGYTYQKRSDGYSFSHSSPIMGLSFDPVRGISLPLDFTYTRIHQSSLTAGLSYGFSDNKLRYHGSYTYNFNLLKEREFKLSVGSSLQNINSQEPFTDGINQFMSLFFHRNFIKYYNNQYFSASYKQRLIPGLHWSMHGKYNKREAVENNTEYSLFYKDRNYRSNIIDTDLNDDNYSINNEIIEIGTTIDFYPGTKFTKYPKGSIRTYQQIYSKITLSYNSAIDLFNTDISYHRMGAEYNQELDFGRFGSSRLNINGKYLFRNGELGYQDLLWQNDNGSYYINATDIEQRFLGMNSYEYFSDEYAAQLHFYHDFNGYIFNKIPLLRKLGWNLTTKISSLEIPEKSNYSEIAVGIDRIGWNFIRPFRFDFVMPFKDFKAEKLKYVVGLRVSFSDLLKGRVSF